MTEGQKLLNTDERNQNLCGQCGLEDPVPLYNPPRSATTFLRLVPSADQPLSVPAPLLVHAAEFSNSSRTRGSRRPKSQAFPDSPPSETSPRRRCLYNAEPPDKIGRA